MTHLSFPLRLDQNAIATDEQDSLDEVESAVHLLLCTPVGSRDAMPDCGTDELEFSDRIDIEALAAQLERWEPRSRVEITSQYNTLDELENHIQIVLDSKIEKAQG